VDGRGLPAIAEFFAGLIEARCSGEHARWGCMVSNVHAGAENSEPELLAVLDRHHQKLREAMCAALVTAEARGQLAPGCAPDTWADVLALLAYGVNLRSRAGADARDLGRTVTAALASLGGRAALTAFAAQRRARALRLFLDRGQHPATGASQHHAERLVSCLRQVDTF
jgi:hypothetical protein